MENSDANGQIIDIVRKTEEIELPTLGNIANTYLLVELENAGAINSHITSKKDEPFQMTKALSMILESE